ncbi:family 16 glycosylhydrolase [Thalassotalea sp. PLHSN55]|uniref:glycoside hydrolase family 16 protein n=1 Tax=Thalassotalea sp. PLHSN55 TaxID=3435888 RepID=UPI003F8434A6
MIKVAKKITQMCVLASTVSLIGCGGGAETNTDTSNIDPQQPVTDWVMVWSDEFDGAAIDQSKWSHEVNCDGGGNSERQCYTDDAANSFINDGILNIVALPAEEGAAQPYTSARLNTRYKADFKYGRFEMRAKLPSGQGSWPAFWMLPTDYVYGGWPKSGEIDILEAVNLKTVDGEGAVESKVYGTLHYGKEWPDNAHSGTSYSLPDGVNPADDFHTYAIEWQEGEMRWYVDGYLYATQRQSEVLYNGDGDPFALKHKGWFSENFDPISGELTTYWDAAPFDQKFHLLLNLAVGGNWPENVNNLGVDDEAFVNGQTFAIDYVRVYQCEQNPDTGKGCETVRAGYDLPASDEFPNGALIEGKAPTPVPPSNGVAQNLTIFDGTANPNWPAWDCCGGSTPAIVTSADKGDVTEFTIGAEPTVMGFISRSAFVEDPGVPSPFDASPLLDTGYISFDMNVTTAPNDASAAWFIKVESNDGETAVDFQLSESEEGLAPVAGQWQTYTFPLSAFSDADLDLTAIDVVMIFPAWGAGEGAVYQVTNLEIAGATGSSPSLTVFDDAENASWPMWDCCGGSTPMVIADDADHGDVAEFSIGAEPTVMGFISRSAFVEDPATPAPFDASAILSNGVIQFDMKVTSMPNDAAAAWLFKVESNEGDSAAELDLTASNEGVAPVLDTWQTYTFAISDLVNAGLDISAIDVLMIFPAWGSGEGAVYLLDNVKIYDPNASDASTLVLFDEQARDQWTIWDCCGGSTPTVVIDDVEHASVAEFAIGATATVMGILADDNVYLDASSLLSGGVVQFEMKVTSMPNDASAAWIFKIESGDASAAVELDLTDSNEGVAPVLDTWQTYTYSLQDLVVAGLDISQIDVLMVFPAWGAGEGAVYRLDNVMITVP